MMSLSKLFRRVTTGEPAGPANPHLVKTIKQFSLNPTPAARQDFYQAFLNSSLILATGGLPEGVKVSNSPTVLRQNTRFTFLTNTTPEGQLMLLAFSDTDALYARGRYPGWIVLYVQTLLQAALENSYDGIIVNSADSSVLLTRDEIQNLISEGNGKTSS
jgi:hypothetical protein